MCLTFDKQATENLFKDKASSLILYKVVEVEFDRKVLKGPWIWSYIYKPGWNKAEFLPDVKCQQGWNITWGVHVYLNKSRALQSAFYADSLYRVIVPVKCYKEDLIGCSLYNEAVFKKVFIEESDYNKAFEDVTKRYEWRWVCA